MATIAKTSRKQNMKTILSLTCLHVGTVSPTTGFTKLADTKFTKFFFRIWTFS